VLFIIELCQELIKSGVGVEARKEAEITTLERKTEFYQESFEDKVKERKSKLQKLRQVNMCPVCPGCVPLCAAVCPSQVLLGHQGATRRELATRRRHQRTRDLRLRAQKDL